MCTAKLTPVRMLGRFLLLAILCAWLDSAASAQTQPVSLSWKLKQGDVFYYLNDTEVTTTTVGPTGGENTVRSRLILLHCYRVVDVSSTRYVLEQSVEDVVTDDTGLLGSIYNQFRGFKLLITFDRDFRITKIEGHQELLKRLGADDPVVGKMVAEMVNENAIREQIQSEFNFLPDKPVNRGDKWQRQMSFAIGPLGTLTLHQFLTYEGTVEMGGKTLDRITSTAKVSFVPPKAAEDFPVRVTKGEVRAEDVEGTHLFDREAGRLVRSQWQAKFKLKLTLLAGKPDGGKEFTMEMTQVQVHRTEVTTERPKLPDLKRQQ